MRAVKIACKGATTVDINDLIEFQGNLKSLSKENYGRLKSQILELDFSEPISVWIDKDGKRNILNGHQRLRTLKMMRDEGYDIPPVPINLVEASSKFQAKKKVLALASQYGEVEGQGLYEFVTTNEIPLEALDDLRMPEIDFDEWKDEYINQPVEGLTDDDAIPETAEPICKLGDIWQLGEHRLMCGDSTDKAQVERLMNGEKADMVFTDPPYGIDVVGEKGNIGGCTKSAPTTKFRKVIGDDKEFDASFILNVHEKCFIWGGNYFAHKLPKSGRWFVWDKNRPEGLTLSDCELAWSNIEGIRVQKFKCTWDGYHKEGEHGPRIHPNQKPIKLIEDILNELKCSSILDLFGGSGSTLIACEKTNRKCFMMEIDPHYTSIIIERWQNFTGKTAEKC